jgi:hypothetical protein
MMSPGAGAGNEAAADATIKALIPGLHKAMAAYPVGSKKYAAVLNALRALTANFGREESTPMVPAALQQLAMAAKSGGPMQGAPPPGLAPAPPPGGAGIPPGGPPGAGEEAA